jgi:hypothetical protein
MLAGTRRSDASRYRDKASAPASIAPAVSLALSPSKAGYGDLANRARAVTIGSSVTDRGEATTIAPL